MPSETLRLLVADDERLARELVRRYVTSQTDVEIVAECASGDELSAALVSARPNVLLLDIRMPGENVFSVLERAAARAAPLPAVIFATAYDRYAVRAFELNAVDYLVKPFTADRLGEGLRRVRGSVRGSGVRGSGVRGSGVRGSGVRGSYLFSTDSAHSGTGLAPLAQRPVPETAESVENRYDPQPLTPDPQPLLRLIRDLGPRPDRLLVPDGRKMVPIAIDDIVWIKAEDDYVRVHANGRSYLVTRTLKDLESRLDASRFVRIHRSAIVQAAHIREVAPEGGSRYRVRLSDGTTVIVSRSRAPELRKWKI